MIGHGLQYRYPRIKKLIKVNIVIGTNFKI